MIHINHLPNAIPDERVIYFLRRHPITLFYLVVSYALLFLAPVLGWIYVREVQPEWLMEQANVVAILLLGSMFWLFAWLFLFMNFLDYYLDTWIVTSRRILSIEQTGLFGRTVSELRLYRIQDVTSTINGFIGTMFNFGDVEVQTAGERVRFNFEQIPDPNHVAKTILELAEVDRKENLDAVKEELHQAEQESKHASELPKKLV